MYLKKRWRNSKICQYVEGTKKCKRHGVTVARNGELYCNNHLVQFNQNKVDMFAEDERDYQNKYFALRALTDYEDSQR